MSCVQYHHNELYIEEVPVRAIAEKYGTPCYVYSQRLLENNWRLFDTAFQKLSHQVFYAVKANSNLAVLRTFARLGSGFDIVSVGELERVIRAGGDPAKIVFSGVGKRSDEIQRALAVGIYCFNVESEQELYRIAELAAKANKRANISLRLNPNIDAETHPYIATGLYENKFGIEIDKALPLAKKIVSMPSLQLMGIACHIGSQLTQIQPFLDAITSMLHVYEKLAAEKIKLEHLDIGGGLGIRYHHEQPPSISEYAAALSAKLQNVPLKIMLEPGRVLVADAGILVTRVEHLKSTAHKNFAIVDAGMNDLLRPALYSAWQEILPVVQRDSQVLSYDIVGPVCESADFLGKERALALVEGDLLAVATAGAYAFSMSSNYNTRGRAAEVMVNGKEVRCVRRRETIDDLIAHELE